MDAKLISEFMHAGCTDLKTATLSLQVYLELCEVKRYYNVEYKYTNNILYFTANTRNNDNYIFIPIDANIGQNLGNFQNYLSLANSNSTVVLVLVSTDLTCVYYEITDGLLEPTSNLKNPRESRQNQIDAEVKRHRHLLEEAALCNLAVTLPKDGNKQSQS